MTVSMSFNGVARAPVELGAELERYMSKKGKLQTVIKVAEYIGKQTRIGIVFGMASSLLSGAI